jgi:8-oxo-dGTP diphosphatase
MRIPSIPLTVDIVVFGYLPNMISVLLIKRKNEPFKSQWAIPGGFVDENETLKAAALRELREETSLDLNSLEQFHTFGDPGRDPRGHVVSVAHFSLIKPNLYTVKAADDAQEAKWFALDNLPKMAFDHQTILEMAASHLKRKLACESKHNDWMDEKSGFTELELESILQIIGFHRQ